MGTLVRGFIPPYSAPLSCLADSVISCRTIGTEGSVNGVIPVSTQMPPLRSNAIANGIKSTCTMPGQMTTRSAMRPTVISLTSGTASSADAALCVAPKIFAESRFDSTGSTATTYLAPTARAPCRAFIPTPPAPMTTTVSPGSVPADTVAEPQPVLQPHDTSEAAWNGIASSILMTDRSESTAYSAKVPSCP